MTSSIFNLERRFNFEESYKRIINLTFEEAFICRGYSYSKNFWDCVNRKIRTWKYREGANNYLQYFFDIGIEDVANLRDETQMMYVMEFIINIALYIVKVDSNYIGEGYKKSYTNLVENIKYILEKLNYKLHICDDRVEFIKRDEDVDSVLQDLKDDNELRMALLSFNDFRIENNIEQKKIILKQLGDWLEPRRVEYEIIDRELVSDIFYLLNNANIRHNNDKQLIMNDVNQIKIDNMLFKMILHLIRSKDLITYDQTISELKNK